METPATEASDNVAGSTVTKTTTPVNGATDPNSNSQVWVKGESLNLTLCFVSVPAKINVGKMIVPCITP